MKFLIVILILFTSTAHANVCNRSAEVVKALENETQSRCRKINKEVLSNVETLHIANINYNDVSVLKQNDFKGLSSLKSLYINANVRKYSSKLFKNLPSLERLQMYFPVRQKQLPSDLLLSLKSLKHFSTTYLYRSTTRPVRRELSLPVGFFKNNLNLTSVAVKVPQWTKIASGVFDSLPKLENLYLEVGAREIGQKTFANLPSLNRLIIEGNYLRGGDLMDKILKSIDPNAFISVNNLQELTIESIVALDDVSFLKNLKSLTKLSLSTDYMKSLNETALQKLENIEEIKIIGGDISSISEQTIRSWSNARYISLINMKLSHFPIDALSTLSNLTFLNLNYNDLGTDFPTELQSKYPGLRYRIIPGPSCPLCPNF